MLTEKLEGFLNPSFTKTYFGVGNFERICNFTGAEIPTRLKMCVLYEKFQTIPNQSTSHSVCIMMGLVLVTVEVHKNDVNIYESSIMGYMVFSLIFSPLHNLIGCHHFTERKTEAQGNNLCLVIEVIYRVWVKFDLTL